MGPCAGGAVYSPALTDFIFMVKNTSYMFVTGPDVVKTVTNEDIDMEGLGGAKVHTSKSGVAHFALNNDVELLQYVRNFYDFLPLNNKEKSPIKPTSDDPRRQIPVLDKIVPHNPNMPYDMRNILKLVCDDLHFEEVA
mmetsp:Transcript_35671/g.6428  ORF Transcript_35671/g.6428 Transcript_35671/m.6428 type:complete len:138 (+) Transcript_35671:592-1005(+)